MLRQLKLWKRNLIYSLSKKINIDDQSINNKSLDRLFKFYSTDKSSRWHDFSRFYEKHFDEFKKKKINILEIGSARGGSAAAFAKYFTKSNIYCLDLNIKKFVYFSKRIKVFGLDVSNEKSVKNFLKKKNFNNIFDIIIDDGSHKTSEILLTLKNFFNLLKPGGYFVIEDYKLSNFFKFFHDIKDIKVDFMIKKIKEKKIFKSKILSKKFQQTLFKKLDKVFTYSGNFKYKKNTTTTSSDICFIKIKS